MKKSFLEILVLLLALPLFTGCYEDYVSDYDYPNMGFALGKPLRTVVSTTNKIYVGVSIGGKRQIDMNDWGQFTIDESLLAGTGLKLLPESYYKLSDPNTFKVRKSNLAVADVGIEFTDDFYADSNCLGKYYALPFRLVATSIPESENPYGAIRAGKDTTVVAIKYISGYSGTFYRILKEEEYDATGNLVNTQDFKAAYLSGNSTLNLTTKGKNVIRRPGIGSLSTSGLILTIDESTFDVAIEGEAGGPAVTAVSGKWVKNGEYTFYGGDEVAPQLDIEYEYVSGTSTFKVKETLVLRQYAEKDLRLETF